jgi:hypothetical protein
MRTVGPDFGYIDYLQRLNAVQRGLTNRFGIRVCKGICTALGTDYPLPVEIETLPSHVRIIVDNHLLNYPDSDLMDLLTGRKSFQAALDRPSRIEPERMTAGRAERLQNASKGVRQAKQ